MTSWTKALLCVCSPLNQKYGRLRLEFASLLRTSASSPTTIPHSLDAARPITMIRPCTIFRHRQQQPGRP